MTDICLLWPLGNGPPTTTEEDAASSNREVKRAIVDGLVDYELKGSGERRERARLRLDKSKNREIESDRGDSRL
jgi:hypothetical protein